MRGGEKTCWKTLRLQAPGDAGARAVSRSDRLAALYRFQNGEAPAGLVLVDPRHEAVVTDPADVDWTHFPLVDALEAVSRDEIARLRTLLSSPPSAAASSRPATPPLGLVWGVDLLSPRAPSTEA
jgi:hypothetical protein